MAIEANKTFNDLIERFTRGFHTCLPGQIETFNGRIASVKPLIKRKYSDDTEEALPVIESVPVVFPSTSFFEFSYPLNRGDGCLIIFSERSMDNWIASGVDSIPGDRRFFDLSDAICIPGLWALPNNPRMETTNQNMLLRFNDAKLKFDTSNRIALGNSQAELLDLVDQTLDAVIGATVIIPAGSSAGTYPLDPATVASLNLIKNLLGLIKGSL